MERDYPADVQAQAQKEAAYLTLARGHGSSGAAQGATAPLTAEIMQRTNSSLDMANEIASRLWQLRDRLFGLPAEATNTRGANGIRPEPSGFASAYSDKASDLLSVLVHIDQLSSEISNRL